MMHTIHKYLDCMKRRFRLLMTSQHISIFLCRVQICDLLVMLTQILCGWSMGANITIWVIFECWCQSTAGDKKYSFNGNEEHRLHPKRLMREP